MPNFSIWPVSIQTKKRSTRSGVRGTVNAVKQKPAQLIRTCLVLVAGEASALFEMDRKSGWIRSAAPLNQAPSVIHLQVVATDTGSPQLSRTASVTIILRDLAGKSLVIRNRRGHRVTDSPRRPAGTDTGSLLEGRTWGPNILCVPKESFLWPRPSGWQSSDFYRSPCRRWRCRHQTDPAHPETFEHGWPRSLDADKWPCLCFHQLRVSGPICWPVCWPGQGCQSTHCLCYAFSEWEHQVQRRIKSCIFSETSLFVFSFHSAISNIWSATCTMNPTSKSECECQGTMQDILGEHVSIWTWGTWTNIWPFIEARSALFRRMRAISLAALRWWCEIKSTIRRRKGRVLRHISFSINQGWAKKNIWWFGKKRKDPSAFSFFCPSARRKNIHFADIPPQTFLCWKMTMQTFWNEEHERACTLCESLDWSWEVGDIFSTETTEFPCETKSWDIFPASSLGMCRLPQFCHRNPQAFNENCCCKWPSNLDRPLTVIYNLCPTWRFYTNRWNSESLCMHVVVICCKAETFFRHRHNWVSWGCTVIWSLCWFENCVSKGNIEECFSRAFVKCNEAYVWRK